MKKHLKCSNCNTENVVIENELFFSEDKKSTNIICPICDNKILTEKTDGWFFVQTKEQYDFGQKIEEQKQKIKFVQATA